MGRAGSVKDCKDMSDTRVLIVDDEEPIQELLANLMEMNGYGCMPVNDASAARECLRENNFQLILCDVNMPGESGLDFARYVVTEHPETALVMISGINDPETADAALEIGAYGYVIKPFELNEVMINISNALRRRKLEIENRAHRENLENLVKERTEALQATLKDLQKALEGIIKAMAMTVETRDPYTAGHQQRTANLAHAIAKEMKLPEKQVEGTHLAGIIHDLGKIAVPAEILSKSTRLRDEEFRMIQIHPQVGYDILKTIEFPWSLAEIVLQHHERMDGSGYPAGLSRGEILLEARILTVADVVEAMASHRPYRPSLGIDNALQEILKSRDTFYDAEVVDVCVKLFKEKGFKFNGMKTLP